MIRLARKKDIFTMAYIFTPDEARLMTEAGLDCLIPHAGGTAGGMQGFATVSYEKGGEAVQNMIAAAREIDPEIICLAHGGPFAEPEDTKYLYRNTDASGFVGASSIERIPIEKAVSGVVKEFKKYRIP
jgi:predicted TIM-barrel enzyme